MPTLRIVCIVEGHGEVSAVPALIRRIASELHFYTLDIPTPIRTAREKLLKDGELERAVDFAARKAGAVGAVFVLIDAHGDCPRDRGPELLKRARTARSDVPISVVLAKQEYEAWFIAAAESIRGKRGLADNLQAPADAEAIQGAKEWLEKKMSAGRKYSETLDQPALSSVFDLGMARSRSGSFDKLYREIEGLLQHLTQPAP
jgi:hypothetical protein